MSIFTMEHVNEVLKKDLQEAKSQMIEMVTSSKGPRPVTKNKAKIAIDKARTKEQLAFTMANWILAHPDEGLKVL